MTHLTSYHNDSFEIASYDSFDSYDSVDSFDSYD